MRRRFFTELNSNKYFSIEILGDGDINFKFDYVDNEYYNLLKYSKNNIKDWKSAQVVTFPIELSDIIYFKCAKWKVSDAALYVKAPCKINGNLLSLCGYIPDTGTNFYSFLSKINVIEIDDSFWRNISMDHDLYTGLFAGNVYITSINISDYITNIPSSFFSSCVNLASIILPDSVTEIGDYAFSNCSSMTSVTIPDSVTAIGKSAFSGCTGELFVNCNISESAISNSSFSSVTIGDSVTEIGKSAFSNCSSLASVTIGDSVTDIGYSAFQNCSSLTSITIPDSVITIGYSAFRGCSSLTSVTIGDSVTTIGDYAFRSCDSLTEFTGKFAEDNGRILVVDGVLIAFAPAGITEYNIPDSVTEIAYAAFSGCISLTSVIIPDSVTTIGGRAFDNCSSLTSVTIPNSVRTIGDFTFYDCDSLTSVYCKATTPPALGGISVFDYNGSGRKIYVPAESVDAYKSATRWNNYADAIVGYNF